MPTFTKIQTYLLHYLHQSYPHPILHIHTRTHSTHQIFHHNLKIKSLSRSGNLSAARQLFDEMPERDIVSWNSIITAHWHNSQISESIKLFNSMSQRNTISWNSIIAGCLEHNMPGEAFDFFNRMPVKNVASWNAMISGLVKLGRVDDAEKLFDEMPERNVISYTTMVDGLLRRGEVEKARAMFDGMRETNLVTWAVILNGYIENGMLEEAERLFEMIPEKTVVAVTAMITGYCKDRKVERARRLFDGIRVKDLVSWNAIMSGYGNNEHNEEVLKLQNEMLESGVKPDHATLIIVLTACSSLALLQRGRQTHAIIIKMRLDCNISLCNALITMYSKCGSIHDSDFIFHIIQTRDAVTWNTIIAAWAQHSHYQKVLDLFHKMEANGFAPNGITFVSILSACRHAGYINESLDLFNMMGSKYSIPPRSEHYACLVDILSRAGMLEKAYEYIKGMPFEAEVPVWGALLGGCQMYSNVELGKLASEKILQLDPCNSGAYTILSNIYAKSSMWEGVNRVRNLMKAQGVKKQPGYSWTEIADEVHFFMTGDTSHRHIDRVYSELERIGLHMEKALGEETEYLDV